MCNIRYKQHKHKHRCRKNSYIIRHEKADKTKEHHKCKKNCHQQMNEPFVLHKSNFRKHFIFQRRKIGAVVFKSGNYRSNILAEILFQGNRPRPVQINCTNFINFIIPYLYIFFNTFSIFFIISGKLPVHKAF